MPTESTTVLAQPKLQSGDLSVYGIPVAVQPDVAYTNAAGGRVEVYTSAGDNDGARADWRSVNQFAYLVNSVPAGKHLYATVFNSLYDYGTAKLVNGDYQILDSSGDQLPVEETFRPTVAFQNQINQYATIDEAKKYVHVLGAKQSMTEAYKAPSSMARLLKTSGVMTYCSSTSTGACLTTSDDDALMHSKYALFEQTKDSTGRTWSNVIWVTSANLNGSSGGKKSNTSVAIYGDAAGYQGLLNSVWKAKIAEEMTAAYRTAMANGVAAADADFTFYPSPRSTTFEEKTLKAAANVADKTNCKAYLGHSLFNGARTEILTQLANLQSDGCTVKILLGDNAIVDVVDAYFGMSTEARKVIKRVEFGNIHDKAITVSYTSGGVTHGTTYGGSANANGTSLTHDELAFKAESLTVTRTVEQQFERLYQLIRGGKTNVQVTGLAIAPPPDAGDDWDGSWDVNVTNSITLQPRFTPSNATVKTVTWESSNIGVATVGATTGKITAVGTGTATITATSLSGNQTATTKIRVNNDSDENSEAAASAKVINTPPTLSMDNYQQTVSSTGADRTTDVVVTWGTGAVDVTGTVALQFYDSGSWKTKTTINVTNGRGTKSVSLSSSRAWRLAAKSASGYSLGSAAKYSTGYSYNLVKTATNSIKPRLYAPTMARFGDLVPFLVTWANPSSKYPTKLRLQYLSGSGWKTKLTFTISKPGTQKLVSVPIGSTRKWRIATHSSARPRGAAVLTSSSRSVKIRS